MASLMNCPTCGQRFAIEEPASPVQCPSCQAVVDVPATMSPPGPPTTPGQLPSAAPTGPLKQGLATAALVFGILGLVTCLPPFGIAAIPLGIIALVKANGEPNCYGGRGMAIGGLCTGGVSLLSALLVFPLMLSILLPSLSRARELSKRVVCAANMRQIGIGLESYASANGGQYAPDFATLVSAGAVPLTLFDCPSSGAAVGDLNACYVLIDTGDAQPDGTTVLIYEKPQCHGAEGGNVYFLDGHVDFIKPPEQIDRLIAKTRAKAAS